MGLIPYNAKHVYRGRIIATITKSECLYLSNTLCRKYDFNVHDHFKLYYDPKLRLIGLENKRKNGAGCVILNSSHVFTLRGFALNFKLDLRELKGSYGVYSEEGSCLLLINLKDKIK